MIRADDVVDGVELILEEAGQALNDGVHPSDVVPQMQSPSPVV